MYATITRPTLIQFNSGQIITTCSSNIHFNISLPSTFTRTSPNLTPLFRFSTRILCSFLPSPCSQLVLSKVNYMTDSGLGSSVRIATGLRVGQSGIESRWGRDFLPVLTGPGAYPASCTMGTGSFLRVKCGRGVLLTTHLLLVLRSWKSRAIPLPTLWATPGL